LPDDPGEEEIVMNSETELNITSDNDRTSDYDKDAQPTVQVVAEAEPDPFEDLLDHADACVDTTRSTPFSVVTVSPNEPIIVRLITSTALPVPAHYLNTEELRSYVQCNGSVCALCLAGIQKVTLRLLPVVNLADQEIAQLRIPGGKGAGALLPQLVPILQRFDASRATATVVQIERKRMRYHVSPLSEVAGLELGDQLVAAFNARLKPLSRNQQAELFRASIERRTNQQLVDDFPRVANLIRGRNPGMDLGAL
jgi:hypothetical protein